MKLLSRLIELYESRGFQIRSSITPFLLNAISLHPDQDLSFSYLMRDGKHASPFGGGLHLTEILLLELLGNCLPRRQILVIGNSFGWSSLALGLANPGARVVAIDACIDRLTSEGLALTNRIAREEGLSVTAVKGWSPDDVPRIVQAQALVPDLILIDAWHDDEHQTADFGAARQIASPDCIFLFHDVIGCGMARSFVSIAQSSKEAEGCILTRTQSGMAILYPKTRSRDLADLIKAFTDRTVNIGGLQPDGNVEVRVQLPRREAGEIVEPDAFER